MGAVGSSPVATRDAPEHSVRFSFASIGILLVAVNLRVAIVGVSRYFRA